MTGSNHVLMFSGGLDSYLAFLTLLENNIDPILVYSAHGSKNDEEQLLRAKLLAFYHRKELIEDRTLNLKKFEAEDAFIPNRNGLLAFVGANYGSYIWFAIMDGEQSYTDCRQDTFFMLSGALTKLSGRPIVVDSPFWNLTKAEVISRLTEDSQSRLKGTYSCHKGDREHCGECTACFRRFVAFSLNGIEEEYLVNPWETSLAKDYYKKAKKNHYGGKRDKEILQALERYGFK